MESSFIPIPIQNLEFEAEQPSRTYRLDLDRGRIFSLGSADGMAAVEQFIRKALITPRFRCLVYDNQYGSELKQTVIAGDATPEFVETETPRLVRDAILVDSRVLEAVDFVITFNNDEVGIEFTAVTALGNIRIAEVV